MDAVFIFPIDMSNIKDVFKLVNSNVSECVWLCAVLRFLEMRTRIL